MSLIKLQNLSLSLKSLREMTPRKTSSAKAGLVFPVGKIHKKLKKGFYAERISCGASVYLSAILEYLTAEIFELARDVAIITNGTNRISPRHILLSIRGDEELDRLFAGVTIAEGGVLPFIKAVLLEKATNIGE